MKVQIYLQPSALGGLALGEKLYAFQLIYILEGDPKPEGRWFCGEFELKLPSRDQAVMWAEKQLRAEAAFMAKSYEERLQKLLALTWEAPK